jgi:hypothetical protein
MRPILNEQHFSDVLSVFLAEVKPDILGGQNPKIRNSQPSKLRDRIRLRFESSYGTFPTLRILRWRIRGPVN